MPYIAFFSLLSHMMPSSPYTRNGFLVFHMHFSRIPVTVLQWNLTGVCVCAYMHAVCTCMCSAQSRGVTALVHRSECKSSCKMFIKIVHSK